MTNLIERYIHAVTQYLPKDARADVSRELCTNIEDMLPENPSDSEVWEALDKLGNPQKLAEEYKPVKRYLIGPSLYDNYLSVLKLVTGIVVPILTALIILGKIADPEIGGGIAQHAVKFIADILASMMQIAIGCVFWVTFVFAIIERVGASGTIGSKNKKWSPDDLPTLPESAKRKISVTETVVSIVFTVIFTAILFFQPQLIAIYFKDNGLTSIPLFVAERLQSYMIWIFLFALIKLGMSVWKLILKNWDTKLAVAYAATNIAGCILTLVLLFDNSLFSSEILSKLSGLTNVTLLKLSSILSNMRIGIVVLCIAASIWDSIIAFRKAVK